MDMHAELKTITADQLIPDKLYTVGFLRKLLTDKGIPSSMYAIASYERRGLIPKLRSSANNWRSYSGSEITTFITKLSERSEA